MICIFCSSSKYSSKYIHSHYQLEISFQGSAEENKVQVRQRTELS